MDNRLAQGRQEAALTANGLPSSGLEGKPLLAEGLPADPLPCSVGPQSPTFLYSVAAPSYVPPGSQGLPAGCQAIVPPLQVAGHRCSPGLRFLLHKKETGKGQCEVLTLVAQVRCPT